MHGPEARYRDRRRERVERYSRAVRWMKVILPVGALVLIGAIFLAGRDRAAVLDARSTAEMAALGTGMRLENPRFAGVTDDGDPFVVSADWAQPDGAMPNRVELGSPVGELRMGGETVVTVTAAAGALFRRDERLDLTGDVVLETSDGYRVTTPSIAVDLGSRTAQAPERLRATGPRGGIEADRVEVLKGADGGRDATIRFEGNVRVTWRPEAPGGNGTGTPAR